MEKYKKKKKRQVVRLQKILEEMKYDKILVRWEEASEMEEWKLKSKNKKEKC